MLGPTENPVEQLARAIYATHQKEGSTVVWENLSNDVREWSIEQARTALRWMANWYAEEALKQGLDHTTLQREAIRQKDLPIDTNEEST